MLDYLVAAADQISNPKSCAEAIEGANQHLYALMQQHEAALGMGSTLVGAFLTPTALLTFNVGDSRFYLFSTGRLIQLSHDDVAAEGNNRSGHRKSHAITQALGGSSFPVVTEPHINVDAPLGPGETQLLCSDGLTDMVAGVQPGEGQAVNRLSIEFAKHEGNPAKHLRQKGEKAMEINNADVAELVDARDLKSLDGNIVWVRVPPPAPEVGRSSVAGSVARHDVTRPVIFAPAPPPINIAQLRPIVLAAATPTAAETVQGSKFCQPRHCVCRSAVTDASGKKAAATANGPCGFSGKA